MPDLRLFVCLWQFAVSNFAKFCQMCFGTLGWGFGIKSFQGIEDRVGIFLAVLSCISGQVGSFFWEKRFGGSRSWYNIFSVL